MTARRTPALRTMYGWVAACLAAVGCDGRDNSFDATLAELKPGLEVEVFVLGSPEPATARRLQISLEVGSEVHNAHAEFCPVVHARASVNGLSIPQTRFGEWYTSGGGLLSGDAGCEPIFFELALDEQAELEQDVTRLRLEDASGAIVIEAPNTFRAPEAMFIEPADGAMHVGSRVELAIAPSPDVLPWEFELVYKSDSPRQHFTHTRDSAELTEQGVAFVVPEVAPSEGEITISGVTGRSNPFRGAVTRCQGAERCTITRAACFDVSCKYTMAYPNGFDVIRAPARVAADL